MNENEIEIGPQNMSLLRRGTKKFTSMKTINLMSDSLSSIAQKMILLYRKLSLPHEDNSRFYRYWL